MSSVEDYILTDAFLERQAEKIAANPYMAEVADVRARPYRGTMIACGVLSALLGAWTYQKRKARKR